MTDLVLLFVYMFSICILEHLILNYVLSIRVEANF